MYLDENILYGWGTSGYLPYGRLEWLTQEKTNTLNG